MRSHLFVTYCNSSSNSSALLYSAFSKITSSVLMGSDKADMFYIYCVYLLLLSQIERTQFPILNFFFFKYRTRVFVFSLTLSSVLCFGIANYLFCLVFVHCFCFTSVFSHTHTHTHLHTRNRSLTLFYYVCVFRFVVVSWSSVCFFCCLQLLLCLAANC